jgi:membrane fusion protein (multidrug efflux system)
MADTQEVARAHEGDAQKESQHNDDERTSDPIEDGPSKRPGTKPLVVLALALVIAIVVACATWFATRNEETTDDAFTDGNVVAITPAVSGYVVQLLVNDNQRVHSGDVLFRIDPRDYENTRDQISAQLGVAEAQLKTAQVQLELARVQYPAQFAQAKAQRQSAVANLANAQAAYGRQRSVDERATTLQSVDAAAAQQVDAAATLESAQAQVRVAGLAPQQIRQAEATVQARAEQLRSTRAQLKQANLNLSRTEIKAPRDGWVTRRNVHVGSFVQAGVSVFSLVTPGIWVTANFKESQLDRMRPGDRVRIMVDAYPHLKLQGHVDSIQLGTGSRFSAFPAENATGNFVKILQRVPVKIVMDSGFDPGSPLPLGLSVEPIVELQ